MATTLIWKITKRRGIDTSYKAIQASEFNLYDANGNKIPWADGTTVTSSLETWGNEEANKLIDANSSTKWGSPNWGDNAEGLAVVTFNIPTDVMPYSYSYTTASDDNKRDPITWELVYSSDNMSEKVISKVENAYITTTRKSETQKWKCIFSEDDTDVITPVYNFDGKIQNNYSWIDTINSKEITVGKGFFYWENDSLMLLKNTMYFNLPTDYGSYGTFEVLVKIDPSFISVANNYWYNCSCVFGCELGGTQRDWGIIIDRNGYFAIGYGYSSIASTDVIANDGEWHTLTMVVGESSMRFYIDGQLKQLVDITMSGTSISTYGVGWNMSGENTSITGHIGTLKVWNTSLTETDVVSSYNNSLDWIETISNEPNEKFSHYVDFNDQKWAVRRPEVFTLTDGTTPFKVDSTFLYEEKPTYRSGAIGGSGTSSSVITVNLIENGYVEFNYTVNSEGNFDWLRVLVDGTEVLKKSGTIAWTTFKHLMTAGTHTIEFKYTKDGSGNVGSDAGAIGYIKFVGVEKEFYKRYLICSEDKLYTVVNDALVELPDNVVSSNLFVNSGFIGFDDTAILFGLVNPEILYWQDSDNEIPALRAVQTATPYPQTIITEDIDLTHHTIVNIASVTCECDGSPLFACEFNDVWQEHNGTSWVDEASGMSLETLQAITSEQWNEAINGLSEFKIKFILDSADDKVTQLKVNFNVDVSRYWPQTITKNLVGISADNDIESVEYNESYTVTLIPNTGEISSIVVIMGDEDITDQVVNGNVIYIPNVTGNVVITATYNGGGVLADGYSVIEYIEATGTQYIDTLVSGGSAASYEISFNPLTNRVSYEHYFAGANTTSTSQVPKLYYISGGVVAQAIKNSDITLSNMSTDVVVKYNSDGTLYANNVLKSTVSNTGWGDMTWWLCNSHSEPNLASSMRLYYLKMWTDDTLVRDFIPVIRNSDSTVGLYDLVNGEFYTNSGTGEFLYG